MRRWTLSLVAFVALSTCAFGASAVTAGPAAARDDSFAPARVVQRGSTLTLDAPVLMSTPTGRVVVLYREDHRTNGAGLLAAVREPGHPQWADPVTLAPRGVIAFAAVPHGSDDVTVVWRMYSAHRQKVLTKVATLHADGLWTRDPRIAAERVTRDHGVVVGASLDVDADGGAVAAWPTTQGLHVAVRRPGGVWGRPVRFPAVESAILASVDPDGVVDVVGTRRTADAAAGVVLHRSASGSWTRECFVSCAGTPRRFALTSASADDRGDLAVAWTRPVRASGFADHVRALVRFRGARRGWGFPTVLARQATTGVVLAVHPSGRTAVSWQTRPPRTTVVHLVYHRPDGTFGGYHRLSSTRRSIAGDAAPGLVVDDHGPTMLVYQRVRHFADIDQTRLVVQRCPVRRACHPWRWLPSSSVDADAAVLPHGGALLAWAEGCTVVFENCYFERIVTRRLVP